MSGSTVVDTNVPVVANDATSADPSRPLECVKACATAIQLLQRGGKLVLDDAGLILAEYLSNLSASGMPGLGDAFARWAHDYQYDPDRCVRVSITPAGQSFEEFPAVGDLADFDPSDRKFVAVAMAHGDAPEILQAVDSKWWTLRDALANAGVNVRFLCPDTIRETAERKQR